MLWLSQPAPSSYIVARQTGMDRDHRIRRRYQRPAHSLSSKRLPTKERSKEKSSVTKVSIGWVEPRLLIIMGDFGLPLEAVETADNCH